MAWIALDFETANSDRDSACALSIALVENLKIVDKSTWLIRPPDLYFDPFNVEIHGITEDDVRDKPKFKNLWPEILKWFVGNKLIAHNASFDMSVLRHTLDRYKIPYPTIDYGCTRVMARAAWPDLLSYSLSYLADYLSIDFEHHDPEEDVRACVEVARHCCNELEVNSIDDFFIKSDRVVLGRLFPSGYKPSGVRNKNYGINVDEIVPTKSDFDTSHPFFEKNFVFTGALQSMTRREAMQKVVDVGGRCLKSLTKKTNVLVTGTQDYSRLRKGEIKSSKMMKAENILQTGSKIEILSENDFIQLI